MRAKGAEAGAGRVWGLPRAVRVEHGVEVPLPVCYTEHACRTWRERE